MKNSIYFLTIIFMITVFNQDMFSQKKQGEKRTEFRKEMREKLNLTEEQEKNLESLKLSHEEDMIKLKSKLDLKKLEMKKLRSSTDISREKMINFVKDINAVKNEIALARTNHKMDVYEILDANQRKVWMEQRGKFEHKRDKMKDKMRKRMN